MKSKSFYQLPLDEAKAFLRNNAKMEVMSWEFEGEELNEEKLYQSLLEKYLERRELLQLETT